MKQVRKGALVRLPTKSDMESPFTCGIESYKVKDFEYVRERINDISRCVYFSAYPHTDRAHMNEAFERAVWDLPEDKEDAICGLYLGSVMGADVATAHKIQVFRVLMIDEEVFLIGKRHVHAISDALSFFIE